MINDAIGSSYDRAEAAAEKPANVKEVSRAVQRVLEQRGYRRANGGSKNWPVRRSLNVGACRRGNDGATHGENKYHRPGFEFSHR
jgi:hypothetical protein